MPIEREQTAAVGRVLPVASRKCYRFIIAADVYRLPGDENHENGTQQPFAFISALVPPVHHLVGKVVLSILHASPPAPAVVNRWRARSPTIEDVIHPGPGCPETGNEIETSTLALKTPQKGSPSELPEHGRKRETSWNVFSSATCVCVCVCVFLFDFGGGPLFASHFAWPLIGRRLKVHDRDDASA